MRAFPFSLFFASVSAIALVGGVANAQTAPPPPNRVAMAKALDRDYDACLAGDIDRKIYIVVEWAPTGKIAAVTADGAYGASPLEQCIAGLLKTAGIPAFAGNAVKVKKLVQRTDCVKIRVHSDKPIPIFLDGKPIGNAPLEVRTTRGTHVVTWTTTNGIPRSFTTKNDQCGGTSFTAKSFIDPAELNKPYVGGA